MYINIILETKTTPKKSEEGTKKLQGLENWCHIGLEKFCRGLWGSHESSLQNHASSFP